MSEDQDYPPTPKFSHCKQASSCKDILINKAHHLAPPLIMQWKQKCHFIPCKEKIYSHSILQNSLLCFLFVLLSLSIEDSYRSSLNSGLNVKVELQVFIMKVMI